MSTDLQRSEAARFAASVFYEDFNDVDVYVEDKADGFSKIYSILLGRLLAERLTVSRVFPLGGRDSVISASKAPRDQHRKSIFIIDGDLYLLCGEVKDVPDEIIRLDRYCIENYLVDDSAIMEILDDEHSSRRQDDFRDLLRLNEWRNENAPSFRKLFVTYAVAHYLDSGIPTVSRKYGAFVRNGKGDLDNEKFEAACQAISRELSEQFGRERFETLFSEFDNSVDASACFISKYVSAKDYTLPLVLVKMRAHVEIRSSNIALKIRMAKNCSLESLDNLKQEFFSRLFPPTPNAA